MTTKIECSQHKKGHTIDDTGGIFTGSLIESILNIDAKYLSCLGEGFHLVDSGVDNEGNHWVDLYNIGDMHKHIVLNNGESAKEQKLHLMGLINLRAVTCE